jgi:Kef-type K+ transport system membrane component KefB
MGEAVGQSLPLAVGVALSPVPIIAVVLMLTTPRARANGPAFVVGWLLGLGVVGGLVLALAGPSAADDQGQPAAWVSWLKLLLGLLLLLVAARQFRGRPHQGEEAPLPKWMGAIDRFTPPQALGGGAALAGANPKNQQAIAYAVFAVVGTLGIYFGMGKRSAEVLGRLKDWMAHNNAVIMAVLCLVIGVKLVGDALGGLTAGG